MTESWQRGPLIEFAELVSTGPFGSMLHKSDYVSDGVPLINPTNITDESIVPDTGKQVGTEALSRLASYVLKAGDVVVGRRGEIGRCAVVGKDEAGWVCGTGCFFIRPRSSTDSHFLAKLLRSPVYRDRLERASTGATMKNMSNTALAQLPVALPSIKEQRRIVAILDEAFAGIAIAKANAEKNLRNAQALADALGEAYFSQNIDGGFLPCQLVDLCELIVDCEHKTAPTQEQGYPSIRTPNIGKGRLILGNVNRVSEETYSAWTRRAVPMSGDLILAREAPAGNVAVVPDGMQVCLGQRTVLLRPRRDVFEPEYLARLLLQRSSQRRLLAHSRGATVQHVNMKDIRAFMIEGVPSLETQREVVKKLAEIDAACGLLELMQSRKLTAFDELKKSLLQQAFNGQLTSAKQVVATLHPALQTTTSEFAANVISLAYARHERQQREKTFGRVKEQKLLHLAESIAKMDMGRQPMRDAAGPNDFQHMLKAEEWARTHNFFEMVKRGEGYEFRKLSAFDERLASARQALAPYMPQLEPVINLLVPMDKVEAEVFATVHAAWNNLLIDGAEVTDGAIVSAAREGWHADKLRIAESKFRDAIALIRQKGLVPDGTAKYVGGQQLLI